MHKKAGKYLLLLLLICLGFNGCGGSPDPPAWDTCVKTKPASKETNFPASNHLVVYLDTSASMSGYIAGREASSFALAPDKETIYTKTLLELRTIVTSLSPQPTVLLREVSSGISQPSSDDLNISRAAFSKNIYAGKETNLAEAIKTFTQPLDASTDNNPPGFHILVTDGVQSTDSQKGSVACNSGSDWRCVKSRVKELLDNGWSGSILGIKSEYQGYIFPEISKGKFLYDSGKNIDNFRPFYLYILSPNQAEVEKIISSLKKRLNQIAEENNISKEQLFHEYPLLPQLAESNLVASADTPPDSLLQVLQDDENRAQFTVRVDTSTESKGYKPFSIKIKLPWTGHALDMGTPQEIFKLIKWELIQVPTAENNSHRYPEIKKESESLLNENEVEIKFTTGWQKDIGLKDWRMYRLVGTLNTEAMPPWITKWSTRDDSRQASGNKTLNLESSFANLWDNKVLRDYAIAEVCFRVGDK
jgi:hypothetical protein